MSDKNFINVFPDTGNQKKNRNITKTVQIGKRMIGGGNPI